MTHLYKVLGKINIRHFMKRKIICDSRSAEKISDKRLRIEVQPPQPNGLERVKRFVNVHLHCIVSNLKRISKISTVFPPLKFSADVHACCDLAYPSRLKNWRDAWKLCCVS